MACASVRVITRRADRRYNQSIFSSERQPVSCRRRSTLSERGSWSPPAEIRKKPVTNRVWRTLARIISYFVIILPLCFFGVWRINQGAVQKRIDPRVEELGKLLCDLLAPK